ncbi:MAG: hypothetical protein ACKV0T_10330 [Planctomycetales bacterium]
MTRMERAILFIAAPWSGPACLSWQWLATALLQSSDLKDVILYVANTEEANALRFLRTMGDPQAGIGETYWIFRGTIIGKFGARNRPPPQPDKHIEQLTRQLLELA